MCAAACRNLNERSVDIFNKVLCRELRNGWGFCHWGKVISEIYYIHTPTHIHMHIHTIVVKCKKREDEKERLRTKSKYKIGLQRVTFPWRADVREIYFLLDFLCSFDKTKDKFSTERRRNVSRCLFTILAFTRREQHTYRYTTHVLTGNRIAIALRQLSKRMEILSW